MSLSFYMQFTYTSFFYFLIPNHTKLTSVVSFAQWTHRSWIWNILISISLSCKFAAGSGLLWFFFFFFQKCILDSTVFSLTKLSFEITCASLYLTRTSTYRSEHETFALADPLLRLPASAFPFWTPVFASCCHPHIYMHQLRKWIEHNSHVHRYHIILNFYMKNMIFHSLRILSAIKIHPLNLLLPSV